MHLLIVDDEVRQVKSLSAIIRKMKPHYTITEAFDGESAWNEIRQKPIQAVITDIRMPNMDGMELIDRIRSVSDEIKIALFSGYSEFDYAKRAIRMGVVDYIVKPVSYQNIRDVLNRFEVLLEKDRERKKQRETYETRLWSKVVRESATWEERAELEGMKMAREAGMVIVAETGGQSGLQDIPALMADALSGVGETVAFAEEGHAGRYVILLGFDPRRWRKAELEVMVARRLEEKLAPAFPGLVAGVSSPDEPLLEKAEGLYRQAVSALRHKFYVENASVIFHDRVRPFVPAAGNARPDCKSFVRSVLNQDRAAVSDAVRLLAGYGKTAPEACVDPEECKRYAGLFVAIVSEQLKPFVGENGYESWLSRHLAAVEQAATRSELRSRLMRWSEESFQFVQSVQRDKNARIVRDCLDFLRQRYMDDISLDQVAERYSFNPTYFSKLFKEKTGTNFSDYLLDIRLENAGRLLRDTDDKVADIACRVGFHNTAYFIKMFKRKTGLSPNRFRQVVGRRHP